MAYKMKGFSGFKSSPAKQKSDTTKTYPKNYTKEDIKFLKEQREDVVKYKDLDEKGKAIWDKLRQKDFDEKSKDPNYQWGKKKKSPAKQEGPLPKENPDLKKSEHKDTFVYKGENLNERIADLEDRVEFAKEDAWSQREGSDKQKEHQKTAKFLQREADIIRKRLKNKKKSPAKQTNLGGTESEKGNIFTKKGRKQRAINKLHKSEKKYHETVKGGDADKIEKQRKKVFKKVDKFKAKHPKTYQKMITKTDDSPEPKSETVKVKIDTTNVK